MIWGGEAVNKEEICRKRCTTSNRWKALKNSIGRGLLPLTDSRYFVIIWFDFLFCSFELFH